MTQFIDANVIIKAFTEGEDKEECRLALSRYFVTDALCLVEAMNGIVKIKCDPAMACQCVKSLYRQDCTIVPVDKNLLFTACKKTGNLNIFDAAHYAAARLKGCSSILSYDKHFDGLEIPREEP